MLGNVRDLQISFILVLLYIAIKHFGLGGSVSKNDSPSDNNGTAHKIFHVLYKIVIDTSIFWL